MEHFTIFQDFYRVIAEMTEEEIVSAISNGTYRETVEDVRRIFAEQGEKAANEKKIELPEITFSANYRGGRSNATLVKYLGYIVVDIDHQTQEALARILALAKKCAHTRIAFISPKGMGLKIVVRVCRTDGTLPETIQEIEDFHHAAYHKIASFYAQLCGVEVEVLPSFSETTFWVRLSNPALRHRRAPFLSRLSLSVAGRKRLNVSGVANNSLPSRFNEVSAPVCLSTVKIVSPAFCGR